MTWFPERGWGGRVYVPGVAPVEGAADARASTSASSPSSGREGGEPGAFEATADFTDVTADENPDWKIDLNEEVIGSWRGESERRGDVTLVWGTPLVRGAKAATAELDAEVVDQTPVTDERFTLVALDAVKGFPDDLYLEVKLWSEPGPGSSPPRASTTSRSRAQLGLRGLQRLADGRVEHLLDRVGRGPVEDPVATGPLDLLGALGRLDRADPLAAGASRSGRLP